MSFVGGVLAARLMQQLRRDRARPAAEPSLVDRRTMADDLGCSLQGGEGHVKNQSMGIRHHLVLI